MPTEGVYISPSGLKNFVPLENNPDVFTSLVHDLGVSPDLGFYDVYSLDDAVLLALIPRPVHALIFITPADMYFSVRAEDGIKMSLPGEDNTFSYNKAGDDEPVMWFEQTIGNACGLIALLHAVANNPANKYVQPGSFLDGLLAQGKPLKRKERAELLYNSEQLERMHMRAANTGTSHPPPASGHPALHFIAYVKGKDDHLWELEGGIDGPLDRGKMQDGDDVLSEDALAKGVKRFLKHAGDNPNFSVVALAKRE